MSSALFTNRSPRTLAISCRHWFSHRCIHLSSQEAPTSATSNVEVLGSKKAQRPKETKKRAKPEKLPLQNLVAMHLEKFQGEPITFEDMEERRPRKRPDPFSLGYEAKYNRVVNSLTTAFTVKQMQDFLEASGITLPRQRSKSALAAQILEKKWGWDSVKSASLTRIDQSEVGEEHFPLDSVQAFLLVGTDGTGALRLSHRYEVQANFIQNPMSLKVTGLKGSLKKVEAYLESFKKNIEVENFVLPCNGNSTIDTNLISRLSGAYVKKVEDSEVSISFNKHRPNALNTARRLIMQVLTKDIGQSTRALHLPPQESEIDGLDKYSLYPFFPQNPIPWQKSGTSAFRYRRVGENFRDYSSDIASEISNETAIGNFAVALAIDDSKYNIKTHLLNRLSTGDVSDSSLLFTASSGQVLFLSPSSKCPTLLPPLSGRVEPNTILHWIDNKPGQVIFQPSTSLEITSALPHKVESIRRLVYRTVYPSQMTDPGNVADTPFFATTITLEMPVSDPEMQTYAFTGLATTEVSFCSKSTENHLDLLIPERPGDIRISATKAQSMTFDTWPEELKKVGAVPPAERPDMEEDIPLTFTHDNTTYFLHRDQYVQRSYKTITALGPATGHHNIVVETAIDHETGRVENTSKVVCKDYDSMSGWHDFLHAWNWLSSSRWRKLKTPTPSFLF